jgi:hypothetical protein
MCRAHAVWASVLNKTPTGRIDYRASVGIGLAGKAFYFVSNYGHTAVIVFFLLSGYFVGGSVLRQVEVGTWSWQRYLTERMSRLWMLIPALLLTLFWDRMGIALAGGPFYLGTEGTFDQQINVASHLGRSTLLCNLVFLQTLTCGTYGSNGPPRRAGVRDHAGCLLWVRVRGVPAVRTEYETCATWYPAVPFPAGQAGSSHAAELICVVLPLDLICIIECPSIGKPLASCIDGSR